jgi:hypothetical protein
MSERNNLLQEGYENKRPAYTGLFDAAQIDADVCADSSCSECGHRGLEYHPRVKPGSYRAFAVCPKCGNEEEF